MTTEPKRYDIINTMCGIRASSIILIVLCVATLLQALNPGVTDVSWLITASEKILDGRRLYIDIIEVNPPASILLYLGPVWLARELGVQPELTVLTFVILAIGASLWASGRMLKRNDLLKVSGGVALAASIAFALMPGQAFAQREHIALIAMLPMLAITACRLKGSERITLIEKVGAGLACGVAVSIKPHFALAILLPQLFVILSKRNLRAIFGIENWITLIVFVTYISISIVEFPRYWSDLFPIIVESYRPAKLPLWALVLLISPTFVYACLYLIYIKKQILSEYYIIPILAALGFMIAYLEQGKGWPYHYYPVIALLVFCMITEISRQIAEFGLAGCNSQFSFKIQAALVASCVVVTAARFLPIVQVSATLEPFIVKLYAKPKVLAVSGDLGVGFPLTRRVNGSWVGSAPSQWLAETSQRLLRSEGSLSVRRKKRLENFIQADRDIFLEDIEIGRPDVVLVDTRKEYMNWKDWINSDPRTKSAMSHYALHAKNKDVELYVRKDTI